MASSSTQSIKKGYRYDVLLSFHGEDTRRNFVDHLYVALQQQGIQTFKDDERLEKGKRISDELLKSIEESKFFIIVFSKNYASSSWCLDELVKIMECHKTDEQIAYPVFYDVDPSEVRKQSGAVGRALAKHTKTMVIEESLTIHNKKTVIGKSLAKHTTKKLGKWREALKEAANLSGWDLRKTADGHEAQVIGLIVERISLELRSVSVNVDENLIGMEHRMQNLESSLEIGRKDVRMIGIKGMGGVGKTTLARAIFDRLSIQFEGKSLVENVREVSKASLFGLKTLQEQVLSNVLNQGITISSVCDGKNMLKRMMCHRKVLIVLDDVDHKDQLEALAGEPSWFKTGSRIIITTRDEQVLIAHKVKWIHDVNLLSDEEAISLFNRHAFGRDIPNQEYEMLSVEVVHYAAGLPLTIKVLGSFLCGKEKHVWIDALERLKIIPLKETLEKLELSYISLEDDYKEIFLDVACFLKGFYKHRVIKVLESCGFHAKTGLRVLEQKSLIVTTTEDGFEFIDMHDHMEEMGKNIVRRLHPDDPHRYSRLWIQEEIEHVLANELGTEAIRYIKLNLSPEIVLKGLGRMSKLKCLLINYNKYGPIIRSIPVKIDEVCQYLPDALQVLLWDNYPHWCLPKTFQVNNLVALHLRASKIEQLWEGGETKVMKKLKSFDLCASKVRSLDLGMAPNLEYLNLSLCDDLVELHVHGGCLKTLVELTLINCPRLKSRSFIKHLESLEVLNITSVPQIHDIIPEHSNSRLLKLRLESSDMEELPSSIGNLRKLVHLNLSGCEKLKKLPETFCSLKYLRTLNLQSCRIKALPEDIGQLESLEELDLTCCEIREVPSSICNLKRLRKLLLYGCYLLEELPEDIGQLESLEELNLMFCEITEVPSSICNLKHLRKLLLYWCFLLEELPEELGDLESLQVLNVKFSGIGQLPWSFIKNKGMEIIGCSISVDQILEDSMLHPEGIYPSMFDSPF